MQLKKLYVFCFILSLIQPAIAQREYGVNDSTSYVLNADTSLLASKHRLYLKTAQGTSLIRDFSSANPAYFIRDVDFFNGKHLYVLVGSRYLGYESFLYKTTDAGINWSIDTSFRAKSIENSINQVQIVDDTTIYLFDNYYTSRVLYSRDRGRSWTFWLESIIANYHGLFICGNSHFLYGYQGDGFQSYMFKVPDSLLAQTEIREYYSGCHNSGQPQCTYPPSQSNRLATFNHFETTIDQICNSLATGIEYKNPKNALFTIYPNPAQTYIQIKKPDQFDILSITIFDVMGKKVLIQKSPDQIPISKLWPGIYHVRITSQEGLYIESLIKL